MVILLLLLAPLFFYKLSQTSLISWDEAWYAEIGKNILSSGNWFQLTFNGLPYIDHPPFGFWLIAISEKIFGFSEFAVRFPAAVLGIGSMFLVYFLGKELFNKWVGLFSAIALPSATWFLFRARSGNLDITLTFLFLLTILLALKAYHNRKYLIAFALSFTLLSLTKSVVPFTIIPVLILIFWGKKFKIKDWVLPALIFLGLFGGWIWAQIQVQHGFLERYLSVGAPGVVLEASYFDNLKLMKDYLYVGVGKWFWPGIISLAFGLYLRQKRFFILALFFLSFFTPFIFSEKGHTWHLIPLHPILILSTVGFSFVFLEKIIKKKVIVIILIGVGVASLSLLQIKKSFDEFINIPAFVTDEAILAGEAKKYPQSPLYIDENYLPAAAFYSDKKVEYVLPENIAGVFDIAKDFLMITKQERLDGAKIDKGMYEVIKQDRDKILIRKI